MQVIPGQLDAPNRHEGLHRAIAEMEGRRCGAATVRSAGSSGLIALVVLDVVRDIRGSGISP